MKHWTPGGFFAATLLAASAAAAQVSDSFSIGGEVANTTTYDASSFAALPHEERTHRDRVYSGVSLWELLNAAEPVFDPTIKQDLLRRVVVATGADGYKVVYSMGELHPTFGGVGQPHIIADSRDGEPLFPRVVSPDDDRPGRFVSNLVSLEIVNLTQTGIPAPGGESESFMLSAGVAQTGRITAADLTRFDTVTREVTFLTGGGETTKTFTGVSLWDFLDSRGILSDPDIKNDLFRKALIATGADGYQIAYSLGELMPNYGDMNQLAMLALTDDSSGIARLVFPGDLRGGRFASNLVDLRIVDATLAPVPLPAAGLLYVGALGLIGAGAIRRRKRAKA